MAKEKPGVVSAQIAADIKRVASEQSMEPWELSRGTYILHGIYQEWELRKRGGYAFIRNTFFGKTARDEGEIEAGKLINTEVGRLRRIVGNTEMVGDRLVGLLEKMPAIKVSYTPKPSTAGIDRTLNLLLSDLHIGSDLTKEEHLRDHGAVEEAAYLWSVVKNVCEYKVEHRPRTELVVNILGDVIENHIHAANGADLLHIQMCRAIYMLTQAIALFATSFPKVVVNMTPGNHGRDTSIHQKRATSQKFNGLETTLYYAVKTACRGLKNVSFNQPQTPWVDYRAQGHRVYATHGDTHLNPGNPGNKIDVRGLENQTNRINASLRDKEEYRIFAVGHVHQAMVTQLINGAYLVTNGALVPPNGFAQSLNIMEAPQTQVLWETTKEYPVGDFRFIAASKSGKDSKIKAFESLETF